MAWCFDGSNLDFLFRIALGNESAKRWIGEKTEAETEYSLILRLLLLLVLQFSALDGAEVTTALEADGSNKTLNLGSLFTFSFFPLFTS